MSRDFEGVRKREANYFINYDGLEYYGNNPTQKNNVYEAIFNSIPQPLIKFYGPFIQKLTVLRRCHTIDVRGCSLIKEITIFDAAILNLGNQRPKLEGRVDTVNLHYVYDYFHDLKVDKMNVLK